MTMDLVDYDLDGPGIELNFKGIHIMGNPQSTIWGGMAGIPSIQILRDGFLHFFLPHERERPAKIALEFLDHWDPTESRINGTDRTTA